MQVPPFLQGLLAQSFTSEKVKLDTLSGAKLTKHTRLQLFSNVTQLLQGL